MIAVAPLLIRKQTISSSPPTPLPEDDPGHWVLSKFPASTHLEPLIGGLDAERPTQEHINVERRARPRASSSTSSSSASPVGEAITASAALLSTAYASQKAMPEEHTAPSRGNVVDRLAKPLPDSPGPDLPDKDSPHAVFPMEEGDTLDSVSTTIAHDYYPVPVLGGQPQLLANPHFLAVQNQNCNRILSTASISTTKATRGSPPPPETPTASQGSVTQQAPYPLSPRTHHVQLSQQQRMQNPTQQVNDSRDAFRTYAVQSLLANRTEVASAVGQPQQDIIPRTGASPHPIPVSQLEQDLGRIRIEDPAPPAYTTMKSPTSSIQEEKAFAADRAEPLSLQAHPAFTTQQYQAELSRQQAQQSIPLTLPKSTPSPPITQPTPPPLPEGWISHLDQKSGQYYYIHLPSESTQWEFPKGPTPINLPEPQSPAYAGSVYSTSVFDRPLGSPGFKPQYATYPPSLYSMSPMASPTAAGFLQAPPPAGLEQFRLAPANGVYFGPYLRYTNMDLDNGVWHGSVMLVAEVPQPPTIHLHQSMDLSPNPRQLIPNAIYQHRDWTFYRYDIDIRMDERGDTKWTYAITSHLGCTRYEFVVAGRYDTSWRFLAHSGNDFSMSVNLAERTKLGGVGIMWKDVLQKNQEVGGFHVQLGVGNQIVADRLWKDIPSLRQWTAMSGKDNRKIAPWSAQMEDEIRHAYLHYYTSHFDQAHLREALASIPHVLTIDDHEIFEGYGSYPDHLQQSNIFRNIGRCAVESYLLLQHHTTPALLRSPHSFATKTSPTTTFDVFTITGTGWSFIKYLGPAIVVVGPDCRSERNMRQVMAGPTYQGLFPKIALLPPCVQHAIWLLPTPVVYPRSEMVESFASSFATGKKVVTGSFNALGKVTSSVAGIVGAKGIVSESFKEVKRAVGKGGILSGMLNPFGEVGALEEARDAWTHESKDLERTYLIRTLQTLASQKSIRMTFLSGGTNCAAAGLLHDPNDSASAARHVSSLHKIATSLVLSPTQGLSSPYFPSSFSTTSTAFPTTHTPSHRTMFALTTPPIVNAPPSSTTLRLIFPSHGTPKPIYVPANGTRSSDGRGGSNVPSDTKEDMLEVFAVDVDGRPREGGSGMKGVLARRGWVCGVAFDPDFVRGAFGTTTTTEAAHSQSGTSQWSGAASQTVLSSHSAVGSGPETPGDRGSWGGTSMSTLTANGLNSDVRTATGPGSVVSRADAGGGRISLAFDFMMQTEPGLSPLAGVGGTVKYGPVVVPAVEYGR